MVTGDYIPNFTDAVTAALEARLKEGQPYFGVTIDKETGLKIQRSDGASEAVFNSDYFTMRALIDGVMKDRLYFDPLRGDFVFDGVVELGAAIADAIYAQQGIIAELTVDELSTSRRIRKYILSDMSDDNYIRIRGQKQEFITGTVKSLSFLATEDGDPILTEWGETITLEAGQAATEQATNRNGQLLYWQKEPVGHTTDGHPLDANGVQIYSTTAQTAWPVTIYQYTELVKTELAFERGGLANNYIPQMILGAGDENGNSKGYIFKDELGFYLRYKSRLAKNVDIVFSDDGFVDAMHRRLASCEIDTDRGVILYTVEGADTVCSLSFVVDGDDVTYTWPDGHTCVITMTGGSSE